MTRNGKCTVSCCMQLWHTAIHSRWSHSSVMVSNIYLDKGIPLEQGFKKWGSRPTGGSRDAEGGSRDDFQNPYLTDWTDLTGENTTIMSLNDKIRAFKRKVDRWTVRVEMGRIDMFPEQWRLCLNGDAPCWRCPVCHVTCHFQHPGQGSLCVCVFWCCRLHCCRMLHIISNLN